MKTNLKVEEICTEENKKPFPVEFTPSNWALVVLHTEPDPYMSQLITTLFNVFVVSLYWDLREELDCIHSNFLLNQAFFGELVIHCIGPKFAPTPPLSLF